MKEFSRTDRIADFLKKELGNLIQLELRDPRLGMVSVIDVEVSRDLAHARVFVTVMGKETADDAADALKVLNHAAGFLRSRLARTHKARTTPALKFLFDTSVRRGEYLSRLIDDAVSHDRKHRGDDTPES